MGWSGINASAPTWHPLAHFWLPSQPGYTVYTSLCLYGWCSTESTHSKSVFLPGPSLKLENYSWNWPGGSYCPQGNPKLMGDRKQWINTPVSHPSDRQFWKAFLTLRGLKELSTYCSQYLSFPFSPVSMSSCMPAPQDPSSRFWSQEHPKWTTGTPVTVKLGFQSNTNYGTQQSLSCWRGESFTMMTFHFLTWLETDLYSPRYSFLLLSGI